jgi:hypothetical protein
MRTKHFAMAQVENCIETLRRLITAGDPDELHLAEAAIQEYWSTTPVRARKSGLIYVQELLRDELDSGNPKSRDFAATVDAYIERKLIS